MYLLHCTLYLDEGLEIEYSTTNCSDGAIRLVGGSTEYEGRLEICINRIWRTVCSSYSSYRSIYWDEKTSRVVCRQLGHQGLGIDLYEAHFM